VTHLEGKSFKYLDIAKKVVCEGVTHMEKMFHDILDGGGEGIILRDPSSPLVAGRSPGYLKHKVFKLFPLENHLKLPLLFLEIS